MNEAEYQSRAIKALVADFLIYAPDGGVSGRSMRDGGEHVKIDIVAKAKEHLVGQGFIDAPFGIEVKAPGGEGRKVFDLAFQLLDYRLSEFELRDGLTELAFILSYPRLTMFGDGDGFILERFLLRWNIGYLRIEDWGWVIGNPGSRYAKKYNGEFSMSDIKNNALVTRRYGNYVASRHRKTHGQEISNAKGDNQN